MINCLELSSIGLHGLYDVVSCCDSFFVGFGGFFGGGVFCFFF